MLLSQERRVPLTAVLGPAIAGLISFVVWAGLASVAGLPRGLGLTLAVLACGVAVACCNLAAAGRDTDASDRETAAGPENWEMLSAHARDGGRCRT